MFLSPLTFTSFCPYGPSPHPMLRVPMRVLLFPGFAQRPSRATARRWCPFEQMGSLGSGFPRWGYGAPQGVCGCMRQNSTLTVQTQREGVCKNAPGRFHWLQA